MMFKTVKFSVYLFLGGIAFFVVCSYLPIRRNQNNPYKQIRIPLDVEKGVPFTKNEEGYTIWGFDVDSNESLYFAGGGKTTLVCFSKNGRPVYRKHFLNFHPGPIYITGEKLYLFETWNGAINTLVEINKTNGTVIREYPNTITKALKSRGFKSIQDYRFNDSTLSIAYADSEGDDKLKKAYFNLKAQLLPISYQPVSGSTAIDKEKSYEYLGRLGKGYVLGKFDDKDDNKYDLSLRDSSNAVISNSFVERKYLGDPMCGFDCLTIEHRRLRNNKLYLLNRDKNMAVITEIDLATVFHIQ